MIAETIVKMVCFPRGRTKIFCSHVVKTIASAVFTAAYIFESYGEEYPIKMKINQWSELSNI